jgi:(1->4)-alpha-D-glucan 1-alpha-D-glucosylmutase
VRLRIDVISEMPAAWRLTVRRWSRMNRSHKRTVDGESAPTRNDEYLLYQMLVGSLPAGELDAAALTAYAARIDAAMLKSVRESKAVTSWMNPNQPYEAALSAFVHALLERRDSNLFLGDLQANAAVFAWYGALNGLTLAAVKALSPGVPDYYQGHEVVGRPRQPPRRRLRASAGDAGWRARDRRIARSRGGAARIAGACPGRPRQVPGHLVHIAIASRA